MKNKFADQNVEHFSISLWYMNKGTVNVSIIMSYLLLNIVYYRKLR